MARMRRAHNIKEDEEYKMRDLSGYVLEGRMIRIPFRRMKERQMERDEDTKCAADKDARWNNEAATRWERMRRLS